MSSFRPLGSVPATDVINAAGTARPAKDHPVRGGAVTRLIVGVKQPRALGAAVSVGAALVEQLLLHTGVEDSAIHRAGRRGMGIARPVRLSPAQRRANPWHRKGNEGRWRAPEFQDFTGDFCDRLILGERRSRCAVLSPYDIGVVGESLSLALEAHPAVARGGVLVVTPALGVPFGRVQMQPLHAAEDFIAADQVSAALDQHFAANSRGGDIGGQAHWLGIGVENVSTTAVLREALAGRTSSGEEAMELFLEQQLADVELRRLEDDILPLAAYAAALWADDPATAVAYANRERHAITDGAKRNWLAVQKAMAPYEEGVLLQMHQNPGMARGRVAPSFLQHKVDGIADRHVRRRERDAARNRVVRDHLGAHRRPSRR